MAGPVLTVRTAPGDFAKSVEAIDHAEPGQVIAIDAGGAGPAIWGELASESALQKGVAGVVIDGAVRDTSEIRRMAFPAFARLACSHAGYPKGLGEIGGPIRLGGQEVQPGDWLVKTHGWCIVLHSAKPVSRIIRRINPDRSQTER